MPKNSSIEKEKITCVTCDINRINGAITKRSISDIQLAAYFYATYYDFAKKHDSLGRTSLHLSASCGRCELCQWLIFSGGANIHARDWESGYTPLHRALFYGHIWTAVKLIQMGADHKLIDKEGLTAIDLVVKDRPKQVEISCNVPCQVYIWGSNDNYTLGTGTNKLRRAPELLDNFKRKNISVKQICMNEYHSIFLSSCGRVWVCGNNQGGRLGITNERHVLTPRLLATSGQSCLMVASAINHSLVLLANGTVMSCGQNEHYQLGIVPYVKESLSLKLVNLKRIEEPLLGICAGKYHSVFYGKTFLLTCGLNGGQLGHLYSESSPYIKVPTQVPINLKTGSSITSVACSSACVSFSLSSGDIFILYHYQFSKIATKQLDVCQIATSGGTLQTKVVNENNGPLKVVLLSSRGTILIWQETLPHLARCMFGLSRLISINYIFLNESQILFTTKDGEAFRGTIGQLEKQNVKSSQEEKSGFHKFVEKSECYHVHSNRIAGIYRAVSITSDPKGKNLAAIQVHPNNCLTDVPIYCSKAFSAQLGQLLDETNEMDNIHDILFKVKNTFFPAHEYIVACNESNLLSLPRMGNVIEICDVMPVIFKEILQYMYTGLCSLLKEGPTNTCAKDDPVKLLLEACNKYKISSLYKKIACFRYENSAIKLKDNSIYPEQHFCEFKRDMHADLYDVQVSSEDGKLYSAHKCILTARLDYFRNMLMGGWLESVNTPILHLQCSSSTLETFLEFIYTNEVMESAHIDGFENLARLLILSDQLICNELREYCEAGLVNYLNLKNAAKMLQLSHLYNTSQLKMTVMQFISLNLETIIENRTLEELDDGILLELDKYHRDFNSNTFDKRIITPYNGFTVPDDVILSCPTIAWSENMLENAKELLKEEKSIEKSKSQTSIPKKRVTPSKSNLPHTNSPPNINEFEKNNLENQSPISQGCEPEQIIHSPPAADDCLFSTFDFPSADHLSLSSSKTSHRQRQNVPRVVRPSQKQRKSLIFEEKVEPTFKKSHFKGWDIIPSPEKLENNEKNELATSPQASSFVEIIASEHQARQNLFKMKTKPFELTQIEDLAMEELSEFYNASNVFDERITIQRSTQRNIQKPTWVNKSNKTLFHC